MSIGGFEGWDDWCHVDPNEPEDDFLDDDDDDDDDDSLDDSSLDEYSIDDDDSVII